MTIALLFVWLFYPGPQAQADPAARFNRAMELQRQGAFEEAVKEYRAVIAAAPNYSEAHANLGAVLARLNRYNEAVTSYETALRLNPKLTPIWLNLGITHFRASAFEKARAALTRFLEAAPDSSQARLLLGLVFVELDRNAEAVAELEPIINAGAQDPTAFYSLGLAYLRLKRAGAREIAARLVADENGRALGHLLSGQILLAEGDHQKASVALRAAATLNPDLPHLHYSLGLNHLAQGQRPQAIAAFAEELQRRPRDFWTLYHLALTHEAEKNFEAAQKYLAIALQLDARSPEANALLGKLLVKQGRTKEALAPLEIAVTKETPSSETYYLLARVYQQLGRQAEADRAFARAEQLKVKQVDFEKAEGKNRP